MKTKNEDPREKEGRGYNCYISADAFVQSWSPCGGALEDLNPWLS